MKDLTNKKFGMLTAIESTTERSTRHTIWKCICDCGAVHYVNERDLQNGHTLSCGCLKSHMERATAQYLVKYGILFRSEYPFPPNTHMKIMN
jgi:hypothetical protein